MPYKMDLEGHIKGEPVWLEGTENYELVSEMTNLKEEFKSEEMELGGTQVNTVEENYKLVSEMIHLKEELKPELTELRQTQLSAEVKDEIVIEEHPVGQPVQCIKEENILRPEVSYGDHQPPDGGVTCFRCNICYKSFSEKGRLSDHMRTHTDEGPYCCNICSKSFSQKNAKYMSIILTTRPAAAANVQMRSPAPLRYTSPATMRGVVVVKDAADQGYVYSPQISWREMTPVRHSQVDITGVEWARTPPQWRYSDERLRGTETGRSRRQKFVGDMILVYDLCW
ncbi:uncharacterized protein [Anabrus simplex]|uniref:uncharacterized protein n=1 Tax=Anabrus simplex TaxID=316456 RepID=UPI0035A3105B